MRWKGFLVLLLLLLLITAPVEEVQMVSAEAEIPQEMQEDGKYVALTFDDGPRADTTGRLLDGLRERGASATFFLIGEQIPGNESFVRRMAAEGHQVGNHTYNHVKLQGSDSQTVVTELAKTDSLIRGILGEGTYWIRPPYGLIDEKEHTLVKEPMIYWTVDPEDWKLLNADKVVTAVLKVVQPGDIVLLHDFYPSSVDAALRIVDKLQEQGYVFVTVEELFALSGVEAKPGTLYSSPFQER